MSSTNYYIRGSKLIGLADVALSGTYLDLTDKPTISTLGASGNWNDILNKPDLVNTFNNRSGNVSLISSDISTVLGFTPTQNYNDLTNKPFINDTGFVYTTGSIGIGTTSPLYPLDVAGNIKGDGLINCITDSVSTTSSLLAGSATGVKTAYDTAVSANNNANTRVLKSGDTMTGNLIVSTGSIGIGTTNPVGLLDVEVNPTAPVEFPPLALTQNTLNLYNYYGAGTYNASSSSFYSSSFQAYVAFNKQVNNSGGWISLNSAPYLYNATTGVYIGTTTLDGTIYGEWLKIELPTLMKITSHTIHPRTTNITTRSPNTFYVFGSTDNTNWVDLTGATIANNWTSGAISQSWNITNNNYYKYYALVITVCGNTGTTSLRDYVAVCEWVLNGVPAPYTGLTVQDSKINVVNNLGVGIGDITPVSAIDTGRVRIFNNNSYGQINLARVDTGMNLYIEGTGTGSTGALRLRNTGGVYRTAYEIGTDSHRWYVNQETTERMRLDGNGNLGIGTTTPLHKLHIVGNVFASSYLNIQPTDISNSLGYTPVNQIIRFVSGFTNASTSVSTATSFTMSDNMTCHFTFDYTWSQDATTSIPQIQLNATAGTVVLDRARHITYETDTVVMERGLSLATNQNIVITPTTGVFLSRVIGWVSNTSGASATFAIRFKSNSTTTTFTISDGCLKVVRDNGQTSF